MIKIKGLLGQEIKKGGRVLYMRSSRNGDIPIRAIVKEVKSRERTERDARVYDSSPIIQITIDCGDLRGIIKVREPLKLIKVDKLGLPKWELGDV